jgi:hypothetical protein
VLNEAMDNDLLMAAGVLLHQLIVAYHEVFDDVLTLYDKRMKKKSERELTPYKRNLSIVYGTP